MTTFRAFRAFRGQTVVTLFSCALLAACATQAPPATPGHLGAPAPAPGAIPEPVRHSAAPPAPGPAAKVATYSVSVHKVPVQSLLFALARDAGINVDIHPNVEGAVTLNALDQTLPQLLARIARQIDLRYEMHGKNLLVLPDTPVWRNYTVDYVNIARTTNSSVNIATQISTTGGGAGASPASAGNNNSTTSVANRSDNNFWFSLEKNLRDMLRDSTLGDSQADPLAPAANQPPDAGAPRQANKTSSASVIVNAEGGLIAVRATGRQHEKIQEFLDIVLGSAKRQVLIEATIIEVRLSEQYQQGINWARLGALSLSQQPVGAAPLPSGIAPGSSPGVFVLNYLNPTSRLGNIAATAQLLESFGKVKVLSSPKVSVLNNQTALLKVVDNNVFFTIKVTPAVIGPNGAISTPATYESRLETVPVGFVMSVTPQIAENDEVTLNVRPTITRIVGYVQDPNPALAAGNVVSKVPVIQARELESVMKVGSGQIAVMGGLMQDSLDHATDGVPGLSRIPLLGNLFSYRNESSSKTELVIFMRPLVVRDAGIDGDYRDFRYLLPEPPRQPPGEDGS